MALTQAQMGERIRVTGNTIARLERGEMAITPPMELLIQYVARPGGVDSSTDSRAGRLVAAPKAAGRALSRYSKSKNRGRSR